MPLVLWRWHVALPSQKIKKYKVARYEDTCHKNDPWIGLIKEAKYDMTLNILFSVIWLFMSLW